MGGARRVWMDFFWEILGREGIGRREKGLGGEICGERSIGGCVYPRRHAEKWQSANHSFTQAHVHEKAGAI